MFPRIIQVRYIQDYTLELSFSDGVHGKIDFRPKIVGRGGVFKSLEDVELFEQVKVDSEVGTIVWPNEVDFDPDVLYSEITGIPIQVPQTV
ncbi:MAG TPA: DUF2442 domain-containing protein [Anaerolineae bacterium]|nr:DUF2442 domain-containing protein [Anaerolineae bacterium]